MSKLRKKNKPIKITATKHKLTVKVEQVGKKIKTDFLSVSKKGALWHVMHLEDHTHALIITNLKDLEKLIKKAKVKKKLLKKHKITSGFVHLSPDVTFQVQY